MYAIFDDKCNAMYAKTGITFSTILMNKDDIKKHVINSYSSGDKFKVIRMSDQKEMDIKQYVEIKES